ncbi:MAG: ATP-binding protein [Egibacteraceae bacterium]
MGSFVGRSAELAALNEHLDQVRGSGEGRFLSVRGRRQVGKSRLIEEFLGQAGVPSIFFTATKSASPDEELRSFARDVQESSLEAAPLFAEVDFQGWEPMLRLLAAHVKVPTIAAIDELPFLVEGDPSLEGVLQKVWDRQLSRVPVLLIVVGSDLSMMEALGSYDRPLYQRMREMVVEPLNPAEVGEALHAQAADAFEAYLVIGGFPRLVAEWGAATSVDRFLRRQFTDTTSPLVVVGERILNAEFPPGVQARDVLRLIGSGETTFADIAARSGLNQGSLTRALQVLAQQKRVVAVERPLAARRTRLTQYRIADPYLRFWLRFVGPNIELLLRGRGADVADRVRKAWPAYRGKAVEPVVRASLERLLPDERFGAAQYVGSYWSRTADTEVDLVGGSGPEAPTAVEFVGSVKWRERAVFDRRDLAGLATARARVPGADEALLVGVSKSGFSTVELDVALGPDDLLRGWERS